MIEKLTGGLRYCKREDCNNTVHPEDYPTHYPFCDEHKISNESYRQWVQEKNEFDAMRKELYEIL